MLGRSLIGALIGIQLMLAAVALCFCAYARMFVDATGQIAAFVVLLVGLCELGVIVAVATRGARHARGAGGVLMEREFPIWVIVMLPWIGALGCLLAARPGVRVLGSPRAAVLGHYIGARSRCAGAAVHDAGHPASDGGR